MMMNFLKLIYPFMCASLLAVIHPASAQLNEEQTESNRAVLVAGGPLGIAPATHTTFIAGGPEGTLVAHTIDPQPLPLTALPDLVLKRMFKFLPAKDQAALGKTCSNMYQQWWEIRKDRNVLVISPDMIDINGHPIPFTPYAQAAIRHVRCAYVIHEHFSHGSYFYFPGDGHDNFTYGSSIISSRIIPILRQMTGLTTLSLSKYFVNAEAAQHLATALPQMTGLRKLDISWIVFFPESFRHLATALPQMTELTELNLERNVTGLTKPNLEDNKFDPEDSAHLALAFAQMQDLTKLKLSNNNFGPKGAQHLATALHQMRGLRELNLSWNQFGPEGARHLSPALQQMAGLRKLNLAFNSFSPEGARHLAPALAQMTELRELRLSTNRFGPEGATQLAPALQQMTGLRELFLQNNQFGPADEQMIRDAVAQLPQRVALDGVALNLY